MRSPSPRLVLEFWTNIPDYDCGDHMETPGQFKMVRED
jgi:hypothetical protein